jgi:hypothetical protein
VVADRGIEDVVAQQVALDVEEELPLVVAAALVDHVAGAEQEVGDLAPDPVDHPLVRGDVVAAVAEDHEGVRGARVGGAGQLTDRPIAVAFDLVAVPLPRLEAGDHHLVDLGRLGRDRLAGVRPVE